METPTPGPSPLKGRGGRAPASGKGRADAEREPFPPARVRPLAIVVVRHPDGRVLVAPGFDHVKGQRFYRPLGGEVEFGERAEEAARREIQEEIGAEVEDLRLLATFEITSHRNPAMTRAG